MFAPLYNDAFRDFLEANATEAYETDSEIMGRLINPEWSRLDEFSDGRRPSLRFIEETAEMFNVEPSEVFTCIADDILSGETGSGHDLLVELLEWIVLATPRQRAQVLGGFAVHHRMLLEDRQGLLDQTEEGLTCHGATHAELDVLRGLDTDDLTAGGKTHGV
jgi:hypothetical protein